MTKFLKASKNPLDDILTVAYAGQSPDKRMYKEGYENFFEMMPVLTDNDQNLGLKITTSKLAMQALAKGLETDPWINTLQPLPKHFNRTILAMEPPTVKPDGTLKEGSEIVLARWGDGFTSPVHGHADGLLYEQLITGKMIVNTYRIIDYEKRIVVPIDMRSYEGFTNIAASYTFNQKHERSALVHNFRSVGYSASLHYVPEHTRDGRDNQFEVKYFEDIFHFEDGDFDQLTAQQGIEKLLIGDVALVRSENIPFYGDHYIVITGKPILKPHGLRPQDVAIPAPHAADILDMYEPIMGLTLLKLDDFAADAFRRYHGIKVQGNEVIFKLD